MYVKNLTCVNTAGIAIGSLGQYEGVFDLVENITVEDVTVGDLGFRAMLIKLTQMACPAHRKPYGCVPEDVHGQSDILPTSGRRQWHRLGEERL